VRLRHLLPLGALTLATAACSGPANSPSILLVVIDTLRADAVSAYGKVEGSTPTLDRLAREGLLYRHAFAPSPWTLPSHATLFTGLTIPRHGVGVNGVIELRGEFETLAERLGRAGYRTGGFSENPLVSRYVGLDQGFGRFVSVTVDDLLAHSGGGESELDFDVLEEVGSWLDAWWLPFDDRPLFVFVNLFDPHDPYSVRDPNPFVPSDADRDVPASTALRELGMCDRLPPGEVLAVLHGLYLGEAAAADAKLGPLVDRVREARPRRDLVTVITSDHGEHLGEHGLLGHEYSVRNPVLQVPLVVHGLPGVAPAELPQPIGLARLSGSILAWAGIRTDQDPSPLPGSPDAIETPRPLFALYGDDEFVTPEPLHREGGRMNRTEADVRRAGCEPDDRVFGDIHAVTRFPFKLIRFPDHAPELYDLSWDPAERSDLAGHRPDLVTELSRQLSTFVERLGAAAQKDAPAPAPEALEALRQLGYVE
jgi:arylsulfatase A-like enzyme